MKNNWGQSNWDQLIFWSIKYRLRRRLIAPCTVEIHSRFLLAVNQVILLTQTPWTLPGSTSLTYNHSIIVLPLWYNRNYQLVIGINSHSDHSFRLFVITFYARALHHNVILFVVVGCANRPDLSYFKLSICKICKLTCTKDLQKWIIVKNQKSGISFSRPWGSRSRVRDPIRPRALWLWITIVILQWLDLQCCPTA
jgi:hypothetical protein